MNTIMMDAFILGSIAFVISWMLIPVVRQLAFKWKFVDIPNARKVHKEPIPLLGGVAILAGVASAILSIPLLGGEIDQAYWGVMIGTILLFGVGLVDDFYKTRGKDFPAAPRFVVHILSAYMVVAFEGGIKGFTMPFPQPHYVAFPETLSVLVTIIWIVGVINVFNFLDGLDGLAAGIAAISASALSFVALYKGEVSSSLWAMALTGAALGFLRHNFFPARIIMGDAGSTLLGFLLAAISVIGAFKSVTVGSIFVPVLALGVPIFDGLRVVIRRIMKGQAPHKADRTHGHHQLLDMGFTQKQAVLILYLIGTCFSLTSIIILLTEK